MSLEDPSGPAAAVDAASEDAYVQNEVERTRRPEGQGGLWAGLDPVQLETGEVWRAKTARSMAEELGLQRGKQQRVPGAYATPLEAVQARGKCLFRTIRRLERYARMPCLASGERHVMHSHLAPPFPCMLSRRVRMLRERGHAGHARRPPPPPPQQAEAGGGARAKRKHPASSSASTSSSSHATAPPTEHEQPRRSGDR